MAFQSFPNLYGTIITPFVQLPRGLETVGNPNTGTIDAAGESVAAIGYVLLSTGAGTSKTISSAGGKIHWKTGAITFANAGTNLRIGIQDVASTGLEDGVYDVQADLVGGTDTITANVVMSTAMESGSKTIAHGDLIAVVIEMTTRGGAADSVVVGRGSSVGLTPYGTADTGAGPARAAQLPIFTIEFNDGTMGWFSVTSFAYLSENSAAFNSGSTPDEFALVFRLPFPATVTGLLAVIANVAAADDFELILYSDPLGTPVAERTLVQDADLTSQTGTVYERTLATTYNLLANTDYAVALRPTTTNNINFAQLNFNTGNGNLRKVTQLGTNWSTYSRTNQTGAFGTQVTTVLPMFGIWVGAMDDAVSTGVSGIIGDGATW